MKKTLLSLAAASFCCVGASSNAQVQPSIQTVAAAPSSAPTSASAPAKKNTQQQKQKQIIANIKKMVAANLGSGMKIDSVTKTPYSGLYEVRMGNEIIYTDESAKYVFVGSVIDIKGAVNYTKQRTDEFNRVNFSELPLEAAVKYVKGDGKRVVAIFEDPNCGYCKKFRRTLQGVDNITIYTFLYNILAEDSITKSRDIWCAPDRSKAWDEWMLNNKAAPTAAANCVTPHEKVMALGRKLRVSGTPTVIFTDGSRLPGMVDVKALEDKLASIKPVSLAAK